MIGDFVTKSKSVDAFSDYFFRHLEVGLMHYTTHDKRLFPHSTSVSANLSWSAGKVYIKPYISV